jgi:hypothetical protein
VLATRKDKFARSVIVNVVLPHIPGIERSLRLVASRVPVVDGAGVRRPVARKDRRVTRDPHSGDPARVVGYARQPQEHHLRRASSREPILPGTLLARRVREAG